MLAEIVSGHGGAAEVLLLVAVILFVIGLLLHLTTATFGQLIGVCLYGGLACFALALLVR